MAKRRVKLILIFMVLCVSMSSMCISVFAKETTVIDWFTYYLGSKSCRYYSKECTEDAGRNDFWGTAVAGRNSVDRDAATKRFALVRVGMNNYVEDSLRTSITVTDWKTGTELYRDSSNNTTYHEFSYCPSPISVFACTEARNIYGEYVCVYPTSLAW